MNKKNLFLTALFAIFATQSMLPAENVQQTPPGWSTLCKSYMTTAVSGGLIGTITGGLSNYGLYQTMNAIGKMNPTSSVSQKDLTFAVVLIALWVAENRLRTTLVNETNQGFEENGIKHRKLLTGDIAWIASWMTLFTALHTIA